MLKHDKHPELAEVTKGKVFTQPMDTFEEPILSRVQEGVHSKGQEVSAVRDNNYSHKQNPLNNSQLKQVAPDGAEITVMQSGRRP